MSNQETLSPRKDKDLKTRVIFLHPDLQSSLLSFQATKQSSRKPCSMQMWLWYYRECWRDQIQYSAAIPIPLSLCPDPDQWITNSQSWQYSLDLTDRLRDALILDQHLNFIGSMSNANNNFDDTRMLHRLKYKIFYFKDYFT